VVSPRLSRPPAAAGTLIISRVLNRRFVPSTALALLALLNATCSQPPEGPVALQGTSAKFDIKGQYAPIALDRVDSVSVENGKLVVHGPTATQNVDLPAGAQASNPDPHWSLTTETESGGKRMLTFTHNETIDDFSIEIPAGTADVHYGTLKSQNGDVMLMAWGEKSRCYWGYVTIVPKA